MNARLGGCDGVMKAFSDRSGTGRCREVRRVPAMRNQAIEPVMHGFICPSRGVLRGGQTRFILASALGACRHSWGPASRKCFIDNALMV